jgi:5-hydroxyisourate hydrolase-like protein (transthyretin family)
MITTQVVDSALGRPAAGVPVELDFFITGHGWRQMGQGPTSNEGRIADFGESHAAGIYRLVYDVAAYAPDAFFPSISITIEVRDPAEPCHVVLSLSPYGYSTYRGIW